MTAGQAPRNGSLRTASGPGGSSAERGLSGARLAWPFSVRAVRAAVALGAIVLAAAVVVQPVGCNQTSHYAAIQSYARGHATIDRYASETCDTSWWHGHYYSAKSPGMALFTVPWYELLRAVGADPRNPALGSGFPAAMLGVPARAIWQLGLWG